MEGVVAVVHHLVGRDEIEGGLDAESDGGGGEEVEKDVEGEWARDECGRVKGKDEREDAVIECGRGRG